MTSVAGAAGATSRNRITSISTVSWIIQRNAKQMTANNSVKKMPSRQHGKILVSKENGYRSGTEMVNTRLYDDYRSNGDGTDQ